MTPLSTFRTFAGFLGKEFLKPASYITAVFIGLVINYLTTRSLLSSAVPFIVSLLVQIFSKTGVRFRNRFSDYLLMLPGEREDPAFVTDNEGRIIASVGRTSDFLKAHGISAMDDLFPGIDLVYHFSYVVGDHNEVYSIEQFSMPLKKWYQVRFKCQEYRRMILVWLTDITGLKEQEDRLVSLRRFTSRTTETVEDLVKTGEVYDRLAEFILQEGYQAVFIARESSVDLLSGCVFRTADGELLKSARIDVSRDSNAPVWNSRLKARVSWAEKTEVETQAEFERKHPFHHGVLDFIGAPVYSFINYHEGDVSIIAFNRRIRISSFELTMMETLVNSARSLTYLAELATANDEKFVQSIHGLCSAAEYSDELTGKHILRVNEYSKLVASILGLPAEFRDAIGEVAAVHDIGKVAMPDIIKLPRVLTPEERSAMELHTVYGAEILSRMIEIATLPDARLKMAREIALNHHQCWNGRGYPACVDEDGRRADLVEVAAGTAKRLRPPVGGEIPLAALIVSLSDNYDALRCARHYKPGFSHEKAVSIIRSDDRSGFTAEQRFGEELASLFFENTEQFDGIYNSML